MPVQGTDKEELIRKIDEMVQTKSILARPILENNLFKFNRFVMEIEKGKDNAKMAPVHKEICEFIDKNKKRKKLLLIPRGHLKSTVVTVGRSVQAICANPSVRILIANAVYANACSFLTEIKRALKYNEKLKMFWGDLAGDAEKWSENSITLSKSTRREPTVMAVGVETNLTSQHYDIIIMDDLVNDKLVNTPEQIKKTIDFYKECLNLLEPGGEVIVIGTRWHDSDLYGWIMDQENQVLSDFDVFVRQAFQGDLFGENCQPLFPEKHNVEHLRKLYQQLGPYFFSTQYMNEVIPQEDADFKKDWFQYYEPADIKGRLMNRFIMVDPAISVEKDADFTACVVVGVDEFNFYYILDIVRDHMKPDMIINTLFRLNQMYQPIHIGIEDVAFQKSLQYSLSEEMNRRNAYLPLKPLRPAGRNKDQRIRGLQPLYASGRILHNRAIPKIVNLEDELIRFPRGKHDDIIDALSYMLDLPVFAPRRRRESEDNHHKRYLYARH